MPIVGVLAIITIVAIVYLTVTYQLMSDYAYKKSPTEVFKPGAQFTIASPEPNSTANDRPVANPFRLVVIGDSTSLGQGAHNQKGSYSYQYAKSTLSQKHSPIKLYNLAVSGATSADVMRQQVDAAIALKPDLIMLSVGANDVMKLVGNGQFKLNYALIVQKLTSIDTHLALLNIPAFFTIPLLVQPYRAITDYRVRQLNKVIARVVASEPDDSLITLVDIYNGTKDEFKRYPDRTFSKDKFHPSTYGYSVWARVIAETLN
ncbi:lipolytic protein G-D-S-L family [Thalassoporum mexicanum PCC 7367]|nr:lipolytic protein G-D-S-L family [Pseudanabaena sp. PCC 7367]